LTRDATRGAAEGARSEARDEVARLLARACGGCEHELSELKAVELCPCPVALARRRLARAARSGDDPGVLSAEDRGALHLQSWGSGGLPPGAARAPVEEAVAALEAAHPGCDLPGCLSCAAREELRRSLPEPAVPR
jgi:hypothetical protein